MNRIEHLLIVLSEECAELTKEISKSLRFGLDSKRTKKQLTNRKKISNELGDIISVANMLSDDGIIEFPSKKQMDSKRKKVEKYLKKQ